MDYKKKYKRALKRAKDMLSYGEVRREDMEYLFSELKENEDERIRKALKEYFINSFQKNGVAAICGVPMKDIFVWLEKQDAQTIKEALRTEYEKGRYDMREEMMKDAVNGQVVESANAVSDSKDVIDRYFSCVCSFREHQYLPTARDKVKLIIVKED